MNLYVAFIVQRFNAITVISCGTHTTEWAAVDEDCDEDKVGDALQAVKSFSELEKVMNRWYDDGEYAAHIEKVSLKVVN